MVEYSLIRTKRSTISIVVKRGNVIVSAPLRVPQNSIDAFVNLKKSWISKKLDDYNRRFKFFRPFFEYTSVMIKGNEYILKPASVTKFTLSDGSILYPYKYIGTLKENKTFYSAFARWLAKLCYESLYTVLSDTAKNIGINFSSFKFTNAKSKWGSCDNKGNIMLNWRLYMMPPKITEYVIVHELCHILEHNHSKAFWNTVQKILPDYERTKKQLKEYGILNELFR